MSEPPELLDELEDDELELDELDDEELDELLLDDELDEELLDEELEELDEELVPPDELVPPQAARISVSAPAPISFGKLRCCMLLRSKIIIFPAIVKLSMTI
ncbi:MAG: hypothetical protein NVV73_18350 [Cellvibrionaceae bacterium]|nr:hypothetical protein [Cellvibrionaceae bacterium]